MSVYACADLHGCYWAYEAIMTHLQPEDTLYFLGDAADRGSDGWEIMKALLADPRVTYIKGNHDDFLLQNFYYYSPNTKEEDVYRSDDNLWLWFNNGGQVTYNAFLNDADNTIKYNVIQKLKSLPFLCVYHNTQGQDVLLSHAGFNPEDEQVLTEEDFIWDRHHFCSPNHWAGAENEIIVHGHTPIPFVIEKQQDLIRWNDEEYEFPPDNTAGAYWYAKGHKVDIDCGTVWTDITVLLNLDTWEETILFKENNDADKN